MKRLRYIPLGMLVVFLVVAIVEPDRFTDGFVAGAVMTSTAYGLAGWLR